MDEKGWNNHQKKRTPPSAELLFGHGVGHLGDDRKVLEDPIWLEGNEANLPADPGGCNYMKRQN